MTGRKCTHSGISCWPRYRPPLPGWNSQSWRLRPRRLPEWRASKPDLSGFSSPISFRPWYRPSPSAASATLSGRCGCWSFPAGLRRRQPAGHAVAGVFRADPGTCYPGYRRRAGRPAPGVSCPKDSAPGPGRLSGVPRGGCLHGQYLWSCRRKRHDRKIRLAIDILRSHSDGASGGPAAVAGAQSAARGQAAKDVGPVRGSGQGLHQMRVRG